MIHQFDHRWATYDGLDSRDMTLAEKQQPDTEATPRYWVPQREMMSRLAAKGWDRDWLMGWRDICRATDERTFIAPAAQASATSGEYATIMLKAGNGPAVCLANFNALVRDYITRQKVGGTHLKQFTIKQVPILPPSAYDEAALGFIVPRVLELTYTSHSMAPAPATSAMTARPSDGMKPAARSFAPSSTPGMLSSTASPATNCAMSSIPGM